MLRARSDEKLLDLWRGGDRDAGKKLFERYYDVLERFFATEVATGQGDLVLETLRRCRDDQRPMSPGTSFRVYLLGLAYRVLETSMSRSKPSHGAASGDESTERDLPAERGDVMEFVDVAATSTAQDPAHAAENPAHAQDQRDEQRRQRALRMLPLMARVLLLLHDTELLPEEDIAAIIGVPVREVRHQLGRARFMLQTALARTGSIRADSRRASVLENTLGPWIADLDDEFALQGDPSAPDSGHASPPAVQLEIVLDGDFAQLSETRRRQIRVDLQWKVAGHELVIKQIRPGSIIVELDASPEAAAMLEKLFASGDLKSLAGVPILTIRRVTPALPDLLLVQSSGNNEAALANFFISAFSADELRRLVRGFPDGARLEAALPGPVASLSQLASEVVRVLGRHDLIGAALFDRLEAERPHRTAEISRLRQRFEANADTRPPRAGP
jgi:RNA polymerase sigma-70 factor (ECF subfamily)